MTWASGSRRQKKATAARAVASIDAVAAAAVVVTWSRASGRVLQLAR